MRVSIGAREYRMLTHVVTLASELGVMCVYVCVSAL